MSKKTDKTEDTESTVTKKATIGDSPRGTFYWLEPDDPRLKIVGVDTKHGPEHRLYDKRGFREIPAERIANYRFFGIRKPIMLEMADDSPGDFYVNDGRGRLLGARAVKAQQKLEGETETIRIPCIMVKGDSATLGDLQHALNVHDEDDTLTLAEKAQRRLDSGRTLEEVARAFGVSQQTIRNWTMMLSVAPDVKAAVEAGELTPTAATALASLPQSEQSEALKELQTEQKETGAKPTVERARAKANEKAGKAPSTNTPKAKIEKLAAQMMKLSGASKGELTKERLLQEIDKVCRVVTGHTLEKLGDLGD